MPYVHVDWVRGQSAENRDEVSRRISAAINEVTGIPRDAVWVVFQEVDDDAWYVGEKSVKLLRSGNVE